MQDSFHIESDSLEFKRQVSWILTDPTDEGMTAETAYSLVSKVVEEAVSIYSLAWRTATS